MDDELSSDLDLGRDRPGGLACPSETLKAYFAGYIDAESDIGVAPANEGTTWTAYVSFGQTRPLVIEWMRRFYGGSLSFSPAQKSTWKPQARYKVGAYANVACLLNDVLPYLGEKRDQASAVLTRFSSLMPNEIGLQLVADLHDLKRRSLDGDVLPPSVRSAKAARGCGYPGCVQHARVRGLCPAHYQRARKAGLARALNVQGERPFTYTREPNDFNKAYFAGYLDGDGHLELTRKGSTWHLAVVFNQTRPDAVLRMFGIYGGSTRYRQARSAKRRPQLRYFLGQRAAVLQFLRDVGPYSIEKRAEIELLLVQYRPRLTKKTAQRLLQRLQALREVRIPDSWQPAIGVADAPSNMRRRHTQVPPVSLPVLRPVNVNATGGVFTFEAVARAEGRGGLRVAIPAPVVRGLAHLGWGGKRLHVRLTTSAQRFIADVRPHPSATMIGLPKMLRGGVAAGDGVKLEVWTTDVKPVEDDDNLPL